MTDADEPQTVDIEQAATLAAYAEVAAGLNANADIWERDGSDPCRVRIGRELANAHRLYSEGYGEPCGAARRRREG